MALGRIVDPFEAEAVLASGVAVVPSLLYTIRAVEAYEAGFFDTLFAGNAPPQVDYVIEDMRASGDAMTALLPELVRAGVPLVAGDDFGTCFLAHGEYGRELSFYVNSCSALINKH